MAVSRPAVAAGGSDSRVSLPSPRPHTAPSGAAPQRSRLPRIAANILLVILLFLVLAPEGAWGLDYNPYTVLGVGRNAGKADIKRAYKQGSMRLHPDKNPSPDAAHQFIKLKEAYQILSEPALRREYDSTGTIRQRGDEPGAGGGHGGGGGQYGHGNGNTYSFHFFPYAQFQHRYTQYYATRSEDLPFVSKVSEAVFNRLVAADAASASAVPSGSAHGEGKERSRIWMLYAFADD